MQHEETQPWVFPTFGGVLDATKLHKKPPPPTADATPANCVSATQFFVTLRCHDSVQMDLEFAQAFFVGPEMNPMPEVLKRPLDPGWYCLTPLTGKYDIVVYNGSTVPVSVLVCVDGAPCSHISLAALAIFPRGGQKIIRERKTSAFRGFELRSSQVVPSLPGVPVPDYERAASIEILFASVISKEVVDSRTARLKLRQLQRIKQEEMEADESLGPSGAKRRGTVDEKNKNNMHFMNYTVPPAEPVLTPEESPEPPKRKRRRSRNTPDDDTYDVGSSNGSNNSGDSAAISRPTRSSPRRAAQEAKRAAASPSGTNIVWSVGEPICDDSIPDGVLRINYRTKIWGRYAGWIKDEPEKEEDNSDIDLEKYPDDYVPPAAELEALEFGSDHIPAEWMADPPSLSEDRGSAKVKAGDEEGRNNVRIKAEFAAERQFRDAFGHLDHNSTAFEFFTALAESSERSLSDFDPILQALAAGQIVTVEQLLRTSDDDWMSSYIPDSEFTARARKHLLAQIKSGLDVFKLRDAIVDLTGDF